MKCDSCGNEVALAKVCPYCGSPIRAFDADRGSEERKSRPRGSFRGSVDDSRANGVPRARGGPIVQIARYFLEPRIPRWQKSLAMLALVYVLSPFDLFPGMFIPLLGWVDDLAVAAFAWRWISYKLSELDRKS